MYRPSLYYAVVFFVEQAAGIHPFDVACVFDDGGYISTLYWAHEIVPTNALYEHVPMKKLSI